MRYYEKDTYGLGLHDMIDFINSWSIWVIFRCMLSRFRNAFPNRLLNIGEQNFEQLHKFYSIVGGKKQSL